MQEVAKDPVEVPTEVEIRNQVAEAADRVTFDPHGPAGNPFHDSLGACDHSNALMGNQPVWARETVDEREIVYEKNIPAQHFYDTPVIASAAHLVDHALEYYGDDITESGSRFLLNKISGAFAWKVGVGEELARKYVAQQTGMTPAPRTLEEVSRDETGSPKVDLRMIDERDIRMKNGIPVYDNSDTITAQVKMGTKAKFQGCDLAVHVSPENQEITIYE